MEQKTNLSALHGNIESKGEFSYYYAHKKKDAPEVHGKKIEGKGIITGGAPVLLDKQVVEQEVIKPTKYFSKYIFYDDDKNVKIKIEVPEELKDKLTADAVKTTFGPVSIDLQASVEGFDTYFFVIKKFVNKIVPEESKVRVVKNKIVVTLRKDDEDEEWDKLQ